MTILLCIAVFISGLILGSFLNCIIYRFELEEFKKEKKSFLRGRSFCPSCRHILSWLDLIPVLSYLILQGKCRYCHKKISIQYPLVELATALLFLAIFSFSAQGGPASGWEFLLYIYFLFIVSSFLIIVFVYDLRHFIIPDSAVFSAIAITFLYNLIFNFQFLIHNLIFAAAGVSLFFLAIYIFSHGRWLGFGDVKLVFFMGLFLGWPLIAPAMFFSFLIGAIIGVILVLFNKKGLKSEVPFGPFLVTGTYIALLWGNEIIKWYISFFNF